MFLTDTTLQCVTDCKSTNKKFHIKDEFDCIVEYPSNYNPNRDNECVEKTIPLTPPEGVEVVSLVNKEIKGDDFVIQLFLTDYPPLFS